MGLRPAVGVEIVLGIRPALPLEPRLARVLGVQIVLDREAERPGEGGRAGADDQVMIGLVHHDLRHLGWRAHALDGRHTAGPPLGAVHAAGIERHDAVRVGQAAVSDGVLLRIELQDVDPGDERIEHVSAFGHPPVGQLDAGFLAAVLVPVAVHRRDHHRLRRGGPLDPGGLEGGNRTGTGDQPGGGALLEEISTGNGHGCWSLQRGRRGRWRVPADPARRRRARIPRAHCVPPSAILTFMRTHDSEHP